MPITAQLNPSSDRFSEWFNVFGSDFVPLTATRPHYGHGASGSVAGIRQFYGVAVEELTAEQRERLIVYLAGIHDIPPGEMEGDISRGLAVPIAAEDVHSVRMTG